jgi:hypothetical protein
MSQARSLSLVSCSICQRIIAPEDPNGTDNCSACRGCDEHICDSCPYMACGCTHPNAELQAILAQLRPAGIERAQLKAQRELMGADSLTIGQQARLLLLTDVVPSLEEEFRRIEDPEYEEGCRQVEEDERAGAA